MVKCQAVISNHHFDITVGFQCIHKNRLLLILKTLRDVNKTTAVKAKAKAKAKNAKVNCPVNATVNQVFLYFESFSPFSRNTAITL